jgi:pyrroline-5-carboxylate reductase
MMRVALLGAGHIASALVEGWNGADIPDETRPQLSVYDPARERSESLRRFAGVTVADSAQQAVIDAGVVVLAMRPADVVAALSSVAASVGERAVVSVAAHVRVDELLSVLPAHARVGRVMPSVGAAVGHVTFPMVVGSLAAAAGDVAELFGLIGPVVTVDEKLFDVATAVAACGPGFAAYFLEAMAGAGESFGLSAAEARLFAASAMHGAAALVARGEDPGAVWRGVALPGGMTAAGIDVLQRERVAEALAAAVGASVAKAREAR